jgi:hypothetical protein
MISTASGIKKSSTMIAVGLSISRKKESTHVGKPAAAESPLPDRFNLGKQLPTDYRGGEFVDPGGNVCTQRTEGQHTSQRYERCGNCVL